MKRMMLVVLVLVLASVTAGATYKIQLSDGKVITADQAPLIKGDMAYFNKNGLTFYVPASQVDMAGSDRLNKPEEAAQATEAPEALTPAPAGKPSLIDNDQLDSIRKRSHLANEGQLTTSATGGTPAAGGASAQAADAQALRVRLADLMSQRTSLQEQQASLRNELSNLNDKYNFSTQWNDQVAIQSQIDSTQSRLDSVGQQVDHINLDMQAVEQQLASTPPTVVVQPSQQLQNGQGASGNR